MSPLLALAVLTLGATVHFSAQVPAEPAQPRVGQPGRDAVWVPSPPGTVEAMLDLAAVTPDDFVIDLGSGDGPIVIAAARRGARALGVEYNQDLVELSRRNAADEGVGGLATFIQGDMYEADVSEATVLALFLAPENLRRLTPTFLALAPGTRIVVNTFGIPGWEPDERREVTGGCLSWCTVMLYIVPAEVEGTWRLDQGLLTLRQQFQMISGTLVSSGRTVTIEDGRLRGEEIFFQAGGTGYRGRVAGSRMEGVARVDGREQRFEATRQAGIGMLRAGPFPRATALPPAAPRLRLQLTR
jgi:hypothetical protein